MLLKLECHETDWPDPSMQLGSMEPLTCRYLIDFCWLDQWVKLYIWLRPSSKGILSSKPLIFLRRISVIPILTQRRALDHFHLLSFVAKFMCREPGRGHSSIQNIQALALGDGFMVFALLLYFIAYEYKLKIFCMF